MWYRFFVCIWVLVWQCLYLGACVAVFIFGCLCGSVYIWVLVWQCLYLSACVAVFIFECLCGSVCIWVLVWQCLYLSACVAVFIFECLCRSVYICLVWVLIIFNKEAYLPSIYFSLIVKSGSDPFLEPTCTKQWEWSFLLTTTTGAFDWIRTHALEIATHYIKHRPFLCDC